MARTDDSATGSRRRKVIAEASRAFVGITEVRKGKQHDDSAEVERLAAEQREKVNAARLKRAKERIRFEIGRIEFDSRNNSSGIVEIPDPAQVGDPSIAALARGAILRDAASQKGGGGFAQATPPSLLQPGDSQLTPKEVVIDANGQPRQAGATTAEGEYIKRYKKRAEESLFVFLKGILGRFFLTPHFHLEICRFIQKCPPFRKLVLMPREHAKTTIVAGGLPPHILIQPAETNIYFPGLAGSECRILLAGETETMAKKNLRVVASIFEENRLLRAFWPHLVWENSKQSKQWSSEAIIIPRKNEWPDPTIRAIGVGGAVTGARPNVMIKDDLVSFKAANSDVVMDEAIEWHKASRALLDKYEIESGLQSLEFIIGTRWAVYDLYSYIIDNDPSVEVNDERFHRIIRNGEILWKEKYTQADVEQLQHEHGSNFFLLYLNSAADPNLTDFDMSLIREFTISDGMIHFEDDDRDDVMAKRKEAKIARANGKMPLPTMERGAFLNAAMMQKLVDCGHHIRLRG